MLKRYLSYVVALGPEKAWVNKFAHAGVQIPAWYDNTTGSGGLSGSDTAIAASGTVIAGGSGVSRPGISRLGTLLDQASSAFSREFDSGSSGGGGGSSGGGSRGGSAGFS